MNRSYRFRYGLILGGTILWLGLLGVMAHAQKPTLKKASAVPFNPILQVTASAVQKETGNIEINCKANYNATTIANPVYQDATYYLYQAKGATWEQVLTGQLILRPNQEVSIKHSLPRGSTTKIKIRVVVNSEGGQSSKEVEALVDQGRWVMKKPVAFPK